MVILGSTREGRLGERVGKFVVNGLKQRNLEIDFIGKYFFRLKYSNLEINLYNYVE